MHRRYKVFPGEEFCFYFREGTIVRVDFAQRRSPRMESRRLKPNALDRYRDRQTEKPFREWQRSRAAMSFRKDSLRSLSNEQEQNRFSHVLPPRRERQSPERSNNSKVWRGDFSSSPMSNLLREALSPNSMQ